jgi:hypothetical protein
MKYYSNINLNKNQLENAVIHVVANTAAITAPVEGQIIFDQSADLIKYYDGVKWVSANELSIGIVGDSGSTTFTNGETLVFSGGVNLTSTVNASDVITFDLDRSITVASDITTPTLNARVINATDVNTSSLDAVSVNTETVDASDVTTYSLFSTTASVGPIIANTGTYPSDVGITSSLTIEEDLIVNGSISGSLASTDITGTVFSIVAGTDAAFAISALDTLSILGTPDEIDVDAEAGDIVRLSISNNPTLPGNVTITGNLTVSGTTTTVDSQTLTVKDPIIQLNTGIGASNTNDLGFILMRGSGDTGGNVGLIWDEGEGQFNLLYTNQNASDVSISATGYPTLKTGPLIVNDKITSYQGSAPTTGQILIGGVDGFAKGLITGASDTGVVVTSSTDSIVVSVNIDGATDGTAITVVSTDLLLLSDAGTEKRINVSQLGSVFVRHDIGNQSLTTTDQIFARTVEVIKSTFTGNGTPKTFYIPHNLGTTDVIVQIFDSTGVQVFADVDTDVSSGNYVSLSGNFASETFKVLIMGTRGTPLTVTATETAP